MPPFAEADPEAHQARKGKKNSGAGPKGNR